MIKGKKAQQEMVGFIIIVVLVMVIGIIFFLISSKKDSSEIYSGDLYNFIYSSLAYTTECAPVVVPQYYSLSRLISSCFNGQECVNLNKDSCEYLNETLARILIDFKRTRNDISYYQLDVLYNSSSELRPLINTISQGACLNANIFVAEEKIRAMDTDIILRLKVCKV